MVRIRRFGVISTANLVAGLYLILGVIFMIPLLLLLLAGVNVRTGPAGQDVAAASATAGVVLLVAIPLIMAVSGWIFTALACLVYNLAAGMTGGIQVELRDERVAPGSPA